MALCAAVSHVHSADTMSQAIQMEKMYSEFFLNVKVGCAAHRFYGRCDEPQGALQGTIQHGEQYVKWKTRDKALDAAFGDAKKGVHEALCDSIDTVRTGLSPLYFAPWCTHIC